MKDIVHVKRNRKVHWQEELFFMAGFTATARAKMVTRNGRNEETVHGMDVTTRKVTATPRDKMEWKYTVYLRNI